VTPCATRALVPVPTRPRATEAEPLLVLLICARRDQLRTDWIGPAVRQATHAGKRVLDVPTGRQSSTGLLKQAALIPVAPFARPESCRSDAQCNRDSPDRSRSGRYHVSCLLYGRSCIAPGRSARHGRNRCLGPKNRKKAAECDTRGQDHGCVEPSQRPD
jgi:hypothetical protein